MSEYFWKYIKKEHQPVQYSTIKFKTFFKNCIQEALRRRSWKETDADDWDIFWAEKEWINEVMSHLHLAPNQRINHFRNHYEITRKDMLIKNLKKFIKLLQKEGKKEEADTFGFFPQTFYLPSEYPIFCEEFKKYQDGKGLWIMKPVAKSQGIGIFLFNKIQQIAQWKNNFRYNPENPQAEPYIAQKYINDPLLIGGKKFDMRIYALCTSYSPLTIYLYRTGFARFTHHRYDCEDITNNYIHLTNVAIQKKSDNYDEKLGGKWMLNTLKNYLISKYGQDKVNEGFYQIQQIIIKTLQSVQKVIIQDKHCFELYGFDILFDSQLKPWLIEVNGSPSMTANTTTDFELKCGLLDDTFTIVDMEKILSGQEEQIGGFDLIFKGVPIKLPQNSTYTSLLGAQNNRIQQLKKLAKSSAIKLAQQQDNTSLSQQNNQNQNKLSEITQAKTNSQLETNKIRSSSKGPGATTLIQRGPQKQQPKKQVFSGFNQKQVKKNIGQNQIISSIQNGRKNIPTSTQKSSTVAMKAEQFSDMQSNGNDYGNQFQQYKQEEQRYLDQVRTHIPGKDEEEEDL